MIYNLNSNEVVSQKIPAKSIFRFQILAVRNAFKLYFSQQIGIRPNEERFLKKYQAVDYKNTLLVFSNLFCGG